MPGILEVYCTGFLIASVVALPALPILPGPWNSPETTSSSSTPSAALPILPGPWNSPETTASPITSSLLLTTSSSSPSSASRSKAFISSSPANATISFSRLASFRSAFTNSSSTPFNIQRPSRGADSSTPPTRTESSTSSTGSAGGRSPGLVFKTPAKPTSSSIVNSRAYSLSLAPTSRLPFSRTDLASRRAIPSPSATRLVHSIVSSKASGTVQAMSSAHSKPVSSILNNSTSPTPTPSTNITNISALSAAKSSVNPCGVVAQYYNPTPKDWMDHNTDAWLNTWMHDHASSITGNVNGFAGAFAVSAIGNPDFSCRDEGSPNNCEFNPCNIPTLNAKGIDVRPTYYVMESLTRLHTYFTGLREAFTVSSISAALSKDGWASTFYKDSEVKNVLALREGLNAAAMVMGISCALAGIGGLAAGVSVGVLGGLFFGVIGSINPSVGLHGDDTFKKSSDLGLILGKMLTSAVESFTSANNILMHGQNYQNTGDIRDYFRGGAFVDYPGVDKNAVVNQMNGFLIGQAINQLYRQQKIFIMGGGACGDNQGIGQGPQEACVCRNGKAWYLYYWSVPDTVGWTVYELGGVIAPPGADKLGTGDWAAVTIQDIINSSLDAYIVAGYNYNNVTANQRAESAITQQWANPAAQGPAWEGIFTIPVCNISATLNPDVTWAGQYVLQPYGSQNKPVWCGPVCDGDIEKMRAFIHAANMDGFEGPTHWCDDEIVSDSDWWLPTPQ